MGVEKMQLGSREEKRCEEVTWGGFAGELKKVGCLAAPMVVATVSQYLLQVASVVMVGHLGQVSLSAVAIATALTNVTGFSLLVSLLLFSNSCHESMCLSFVLSLVPEKEKQYKNEFLIFYFIMKNIKNQI